MPNLQGQTLKGRYQIGTLIGQGRMVSVYRAWDTHGGRPVAVKVLHTNLADDDAFMQRLGRDAPALAALSHTNIVRFHSLERSRSTSFVVTDYVEGVTLRDRLRQASGAPLPLEETLRILEQVCAALHYAHGENVPHGNLTPDNILIRPDPSGATGSRVLATDFAIAMTGDPAYLSPEQRQGQPLDTRSDVYSLGVLAYEMLTGRQPFPVEGEDKAAGGISQEGPHAAPPPLRQLNPDLPVEVEGAVLKALGQEPEERWSMVLTFWVALSRFPGQPSRGAHPELQPTALPALQVPESVGAAAPAPVVAIPSPRAGRRPALALLLGALTVTAAAIVLARGLGDGALPTPTPNQLAAELTQPTEIPTWTPSPEPATPTAAAPAFTLLDTLHDLPAATVAIPVADVWQDPATEGQGDSLQTQLVMGERVIITGETATGYWIVAVEQPSSKDELGYPGWVRRAALVPGVPLAQSYAVVMVPQTAVRAEPTPSGAVLTWLYLDSRLPELAREGEWLQVRLPDGQVGWIVGSGVRTTAGLDTPARPDEILATAATLVGTPYRWGGTTPAACDCSGFTYRVYHAHGITIPRDSADQAQMGGAPLTRADLQPGDLVFTALDEDLPISHVAIVVGRDQIVDCGLGGLKIRTLSEVLLDRVWKGGRNYLR
jgi:cell wall-associated NlpC family hydrolase